MSGENAVEQRRLQQVYEALDSRADKQAVKLLEKLLKSSPKCQVGWALLALANQRIGRAADAEAAAQEVISQVPTDPNVLNTLSLYLVKAGKGHELLKVYENAVASSPNDVELLTELFYATARVRDFMGQQRIAMRIFKTTGSAKHLYWAVASLYMEDMRKDSDPGKLSTLGLALLSKVPAGHRLTEECLHIRLELLKRSGKLQDALDLIRSDPARNVQMREKDRQLEEVDLLFSLGQREEAWDIVEQLLVADPDQWSLYETLVEGFCRDSNIGEDLSKVDALVKRIKGEQDERMRGPQLAHMYILRRQLECSCAESTALDELFTLVCNYISANGNRGSTVIDCLPYLQFLQAQGMSTQKIVDGVRTAASVDTENIEEFLQSPDNFSLYSGYLKLRYALMAASTEHLREGLTECLKALSLHWDNVVGGQEAAAEGDPAQEFCADVASVACAYMLDLYLVHKSKSYLLTALCMNTSLLKVRPVAFDLRLLAIVMLRVLGLADWAVEHYHALDIKHIQHDSMSFLLSDGIDLALDIPESSVYHSEIWRYGKSINSELPDLAVQGFAQEAYSRLWEGYVFEDRALKSSQVTESLIRTTMATFILNPPAVDAEDTLERFRENVTQAQERLSDMRCNSDFLVFPSWIRAGRDYWKEVASPIAGSVPPERYCVETAEMLRSIVDVCNKDSTLMTAPESLSPEKIWHCSRLSCLVLNRSRIAFENQAVLELLDVNQESVVDELHSLSKSLFAAVTKKAELIRNVVEAPLFEMNTPELAYAVQDLLVASILLGEVCQAYLPTRGKRRKMKGASEFRATLQEVQAVYRTLHSEDERLCDTAAEMDRCKAEVTDFCDGHVHAPLIEASEAFVAKLETSLKLQAGCLSSTLNRASVTLQNCKL